MSSDRSSIRDRMRAQFARHKEHAREQMRQQAERGRHAHRRGDGLSVEQIAAAAVAIADAQGLDALSMRKIAAVLGSGTMSLYHHVRTKDDLLAIMDDLIMGEVLVPARDLNAGWRKAMSAIARSTHRTFIRHPWALTAQRTAQRGVNALRHVDQSLAALADTHLTPEAKLAVLAIVDDYVFGRAMRSAVMPRITGREAGAAMQEAARLVSERLASGDFPNLSAMIGNSTPLEVMRRMADSFVPEQWFEQGLEAVLDGIAIRFGLSGAPEPIP